MLFAASQTLHPPIQYSRLWLLLGLLTFALMAGWYGLVFWLNRRRRLSTIADLQPLSRDMNLAAIKAKYLALIDAHYQAYQQKKSTKRQLHKDLSMVVRSFVYEANQIPATRLTLEDFKLLPYPALQELIGEYYVDEFARIESGEPAHSVEAAKRLVTQWV